MGYTRMRKILQRAPESTALWILLALALRLVVVALTTGAGYDITSYTIQAQSVLTHHNIYTFTDRYPYPPVWVWLVALAQWIANTTGLSFGGLARLPGIAGDVLIVALLQRAKGSKAALFYAVNPVSILITAGHGQFDGLVMALVVAAWVLWDTRQRRNAAWAALALGGAIALKGYPVLLLPALLVGAAGWKRRVLLTGLALAPLLVCVLVYSAFFGLEPAMISHVLGYQSPPILGWSLYFNNLLPRIWPASFIGGLLVLALFLTAVTRAALLLFPVLLAVRKPSWSLESLWLVTFLGFYLLAPGLSPQYLLWALPLLALVDLKKGVFYTAFSTPALVFLYLAEFPEAVPWGLALTAAAPNYIWLLSYWAANLVWWFACLSLLSRLLRAGQGVPGKSSAQRGKAARTLPALRLSFVGIRATAPHRYESFDSSTPVSASQPETAETRAENQPGSGFHRYE
jgi:hypothetical protein